MKAIILAAISILVILNANAQTKVKLPGVYLDLFSEYPLSAHKLPFLSDSAYHEIDSKRCSNSVITVSNVSDSLLSKYINQVMMAVSQDLAYKNLADGVEIWYGIVVHNLRLDYSLTGFYFRHTSDSTQIYIHTTYSLPPHRKKPKINFSENIGKFIRDLLKKDGY